jgi:hypothetical protein
MAAMGCLLLGVSVGAARAQVQGCGDGVLDGETFDDTLRVTGTGSCTIINSTVGGDIRVINLDNVVLINNRVGGTIRVDGNAGMGTATVKENTVFRGNLVVRDMETANVTENETLTGSIRVVFNVSAFVQANIAEQVIECRGNTNVEGLFNYAPKDRC